jgi:outer membrane protein OmpA-like peptidoglycan-associated protein
MNTYNETGNGYNRADGIDVDDFGNVFVRGWNQTYAYITLKYDKNGKQQWAQFYKKKDGSTGILANNNILVDKNGNVYILGNEEIENKNTFILIKYNNNGIEQWLKKFDTGKKCYACCLNIDSDNNIYITGDGFLTVKYDTFGNEITNFSHDDTDHNLIRARSVVLDKQNNLYITGCIFINKTKMDFLTIKFSQFSINNKESQIFTDAQKAFNEGKYILVLELLKDFPLDNVLYFDAVSLMNEALVYITSNNYQNFVTVSGSISCGCSKNISGYIVFEDMNTRLPVGRCGITSNGYYCIVLPSGKIYSYYIDSKDFYPISRVVDFTSLKQNLNHKDNITIVSYEEMKNQQLSIRINNIFFDFNKSELQPESYPELDRLYKFLNDNSDINVEISGHTDNIGADEYNITLSNARANSVKEYLVSKGINSSRIISKGYGKSNPVATNDTDEGRQLNRRVEFKILK